MATEREHVRVHYEEELEALEQRALDGLDIVVELLDRAIEAAEQQDIELAQLVVDDDDRVDGRYLELHQELITLLATQAPVATDLRLISALMHVMHHMERMGDQCVNIAKLVPIAGHNPPASDEMLQRIDTMGKQARSLVRQSKVAFAQRDVDMARDLVRQDDVIDRCNREAFRIAIEIGDEADRREWAMTMMLVARALERIGDNAVDIGEQVAFVVTGLFQEFEDASHPGVVAPQPQPRS
jgi:phosphate transport system protein